MTTSDQSTIVMERYAAMQSPQGRWKLKTRLFWKRLAWQAALASSDLAKRAFDIVISATALLVLCPLFFVIWSLIKLEDGGPVIFAQTRVGRHGLEFKMFKFRSMCLDAEARLLELLKRNQHKEGITFKIKNDPRLTRTGKWLRKFSFDELPQFYNVLIGNMSIVGPRPPLPREVALYTPADRRRLAIKPGITCFWQIGGRSEIDFSGQVQLDVRYIECQSCFLYVKILVKTIPAVLSGRGAC